MREEPQKQERKITDINLPRILEDFFAINNDFISEIGNDRCECCGSGLHRVDPKTKIINLGNYRFSSFLGTAYVDGFPSHVAYYSIALKYNGDLQRFR